MIGTNAKSPSDRTTSDNFRSKEKGINQTNPDSPEINIDLHKLTRNNQIRGKFIKTGGFNETEQTNSFTSSRMPAFGEIVGSEIDNSRAIEETQQSLKAILLQNMSSLKNMPRPSSQHSGTDHIRTDERY